MQQNKNNQHEKKDTLGKNFEDKLPKNVRQIGNVSQPAKIYIEEYALNYIKRVQKEKQSEGNKASFVLVGEKHVAPKATYFFIPGVVELDYDVRKNDPQMPENIKKQLTSTVEKYFGRDKSTISQVGWSSQTDSNDKIPQEYEKYHRENFGANNTLFLGLGEDGEENFYINENGKLKKQQGYYVYFDRSEGMQQYASDCQINSCVEMEPIMKGKSEAYRMLLSNRKEEMQRKHMLNFMYAASTFLVMVVIVLGITLINHYDKLKDMQEVIASLSKSAIIGQDSDEAEPKDASIAALRAEEADASSYMQDDNSQTGDGIQDSAVVSGAGQNLETSQDGSDNMDGQQVGTSPENVGTDASDNNGSDNEASNSDAPDNDTSSEGEDGQESSGDGGQGSESNSSEPAMESRENLRSYEVKPGDTLIGISRKIYGDASMVEEICKCNGIENSDEIVAGKKIWLP